jgi:hypothetical protein
MNCLNCANWQMRGNPEMAVQGFARCAIQEKWRFFPARQVCKKFEQADPRAVAQRTKVLERLKA